MKIVLSIAAVAASATFISSAALAQATANGNMAVSATVSRTCTVVAEALAFAVSGTGAALDQSLISVSCSAGSAIDEPTVSLSNGLNATAPALRNLVGGDSGVATIPYTLSAAPGGANLTPANAVDTTPNGNGTSYSTTIHGSIAANAGYQVGDYADTVTVTVTYAATDPV